MLIYFPEENKRSTNDLTILLNQFSSRLRKKSQKKKIEKNNHNNNNTTEGGYKSAGHLIH